MSAESIISKSKGIFLAHYPLLLLLALTLFYFSPIVRTDATLYNVHYINDLTFHSEHMRKWMHEGEGVPLWTPYFYAGQPLIAIPENYLLDLNSLFILLTNNIFLSMNLALISYFFLAGAGMFFLVRALSLSTIAAMISSIIYSFNGLVLVFIIPGHLNLLESYAIMPFAFLCLHRAIHEEKWVVPSAFLGVLLALAILGGSIIFLLYCCLLLGLYALWNLWSSTPLARIKRLVLVALISAPLFLGLSAIKLLPTLEFTAISSRAAGVSFDEYLGNPMSLASAFSHLISNASGVGFVATIGFVGFALVLLSLFSFRKKIVLFFWLVGIFGVLLASATFLSSWFYHLPGFSQMRHIERALVLFVFCASTLAGFGFLELMKRIRNIRPSSFFSKEWAVGLLIMVILVVELMVMHPNKPYAADVVRPWDIPIVEGILADMEERGIGGNSGRIATYGLSTPIGAAGYNFYSQANLSEVKGGGGIWIPEYTYYLGAAQSLNSAQLYGVLHARYLISEREIEKPGLTLIDTYQDCKECPVWEAYGPYLYYNERALSSAQLVSDAVLLVGDEMEQRSLSLWLLDKMNLSSLAIIKGEGTISAHSLEDLKKYRYMVLLSGSLSVGDGPALAQYVQNGGILLPDITKGEMTLNDSMLLSLMNNKGKSVPLEMTREGFNALRIGLAGEEGWAILSERAAHFPGWVASIDGGPAGVSLMKADEAISAIYVKSGQKELQLQYRPSSFYRGALISAFTLVALILLLGHQAYYSLRSRKKEEESISSSSALGGSP